jgi:UDP-N-acetylmuramyl tripeptide synthase
VLETTESDPGILRDWERRVRLAERELRWPAAALVAVPHASGASLAFSAPADQLFTATEVDEWALCATLAERDPARSASLIAALALEQPEETEPPVLDADGAMLRLRRRAAREANPRLRALLDAATARALPFLCDDDLLTLGTGAGGRGWLLHQLPDAAGVPWSDLHGIPTALVTGTNGKTTVVRLIAACAAASGHKTGYCCTDGVFVGEHAIGTGDYSGPAGARRVLRDTRVTAAILETARGGLLRRGLAVGRADVAVITSIAADHFGEFGIHDLEALAGVKLTVARALDDNGLLVVNADDALLARRSPEANKPLGWFARDADHWLLAVHRHDGGTICGVRNGRLMLTHQGREHDLGAVAAMPIAAGGHSLFNVSNLAAAAIAAAGLGVEPAIVAAVFARFGADPEDNAGRLMRFELGGLNLIVDFAHNPAALSGLVDFAMRLRERGRLVLLLGQAGNREDSDIDRLAAVAAAARPDLVVVKELTGYLRGRAAGEVPALLRRALLRAGVADASIAEATNEDAAVRHALSWARPGDVLVLPLHSRDGRAAALGLIDRLRRLGWTAGQPMTGQGPEVS